MTKSELIQRIAELNPHLYHRDVERIVSTIFEEITGALARGDRGLLVARPAVRAHRRLERVRYCNRRLFRDLNRCQATFGYGSPTYYRCEQRTHERFGVGCENPR